MRYALRLFFGHPTGHDLRKGLSLKIGDETVFVHGKLSIIIEDERGHKFVVSAKGAAGIKSCILCQNVVKLTSDLLPDPTNFLVSSTCLDVRRFVPHTKGSIQGIFSRLKAMVEDPLVSKAAVEREQVLLGFTYIPETLVSDPHLDIDIPGTLQWDWMHCYLVNGLFQREVSEFASRLKGHSLGADRIHDYLQSWNWPRGYVDAKSCFAKHKLTGSASQCISLAPVLERYLIEEVEPSGLLPVETASCRALCQVLQMLMVVNSGIYTAVDLGVAISNHLGRHRAAYDEDLFAPKDHWILHLPRLYQMHGILISCFLMERKHRVCKRFMNDRRNTKSFDYGVMSEITVQHLYELEHHKLFAEDMLAPHAASKTLRAAIGSVFNLSDDDEVVTSRSVHVKCRAVLMQDVVAVERDGCIQFAQVWFHCRVNGVLFSCLSFWELVEFHEQHARCRVCCAPEMIQTACIIESCWFRSAPAGAETIIIFAQRLRQRVGGR